MADLVDLMDLDDDTARKILRAATGKARELNTRMNVAVVGVDGHLKAFFRMEGAWTGSIELSIQKAKTARKFNMPTGEAGNLNQPGGPLYQVEHSNDGLITIPGGLPLTTTEGEIVGAIGVSGDTIENDQEVAMAGLQYLQEN